MYRNNPWKKGHTNCYDEKAGLDSKMMVPKFAEINLLLKDLGYLLAAVKKQKRSNHDSTLHILGISPISSWKWMKCVIKYWHTCREKGNWANSPFGGAVRSHAKAACERMCECVQWVGCSLARYLHLALHATWNGELTDDQRRIRNVTKLNCHGTLEISNN